MTTITTIGEVDRKRRLRRGSSLIELSIVLLLLGIIGVVGSLRYASTTAKYRVTKAAEQIAATLEAARHLSRNQNRRIRLTFDLAGNGYTVDGLSHPNHPSFTTYVVNVSDYGTGMIIQSVTFNSGYIEYGPLGMPSGAGSVAISDGTTTRSVTVALGTGSVSIQ